MLSFSSTAQIVINEGSNRNYSTLADEDGDYPDWIELYNAGSPAACGFASGAVSNMRPNMQLNGIAIGTGTVQNCNTCYPAPYRDWYWCAKNQMIIVQKQKSIL